MTTTLPIGVFDSGLGGLTVLKELSKALPSENFVYLGDVARLPYGTKSTTVVQRYARSCYDFLLRHEVKLVVIACNTATAMALENLRAAGGPSVVGVIEAGARAGIKATRSGQVLVLATESTVRSDAYRKEFSRLAPELGVSQLACPLLVPLAEAGWFDHAITRDIIQTYLAEIDRSTYDAVVMGCTHYPLLEKSFRSVLGEEIPLVHSGAPLAEEVKTLLASRNLLSASSAPGQLAFYATDHVSRKLPIVTALFGDPIEFELVDL